MNQIQAIQTHYKGYHFRSRLEARWAVYFDTVGVKWLYEDEGYILSNGMKYLPDFFFPDYNIYVEIKPDSYQWEDAEKHLRFAMEKETTIVIHRGLPNGLPGKAFDGGTEDDIKNFDPDNHNDVILFPELLYGKYGDVYYAGSEHDDYFLDVPKMLNAIEAALSARF